MTWRHRAGSFALHASGYTRYVAEYDLRVGADADLSWAAAVVERCCHEAGLRITLRDTLAAYPGCVHWHLKYGKEKGTLEVTLWPAQRRAWFKVATNRDGPWIAAAIERLKPCIESALR
jgi:hypothetical protein